MSASKRSWEDQQLEQTNDNQPDEVILPYWELLYKLEQQKLAYEKAIPNE